MFAKLEIYAILFFVSVVVFSRFAAAGAQSMGRSSEMVDLWELANEKKDLLRFSTLFTAQNARDLLSDQSGLEKAIEC